MKRVNGMTGWVRRSPLRGIAILIPFVLLALTGIAYTHYVQRQADERWCELITILDVQYQSVPPDSEVGRRFAEAIHRLLEELPC